MNMTFKRAPFKPWTLLDDRIVFGRDEIMLEDIVGILESKATWASGGGVTTLTLKNKKNYSLSYPFKAADDYKIASQYIRAHSGHEAIRLEQAEKDLGHDEIRKRCNVCGEVFCYTQEDVRKNALNELEAGAFRIGTIGNAVGGTVAGAYANKHMANEAEKRVINFDECPKCHSKDLTRLTGEDWENYGKSKADAPKNDLTVAESLKAYKDLLDSGVITQEEFDAKKKQLLGL